MEVKVNPRDIVCMQHAVWNTGKDGSSFLTLEDSSSIINSSMSLNYKYKDKDKFPPKILQCSLCSSTLIYPPSLSLSLSLPPSFLAVLFSPSLSLSLPYPFLNPSLPLTSLPSATSLIPSFPPSLPPSLLAVLLSPSLSLCSVRQVNENNKITLRISSLL